MTDDTSNLPSTHRAEYESRDNVIDRNITDRHLEEPDNSDAATEFDADIQTARAQPLRPACTQTSRPTPNLGDDTIKTRPGNYSQQLTLRPVHENATIAPNMSALSALQDILESSSQTYSSRGTQQQKYSRLALGYRNCGEKFDAKRQLVARAYLHGQCKLSVGQRRTVKTSMPPDQLAGNNSSHMDTTLSQLHVDTVQRLDLVRRRQSTNIISSNYVNLEIRFEDDIGMLACHSRYIQNVSQIIALRTLTNIQVAYSNRD